MFREQTVIKSNNMIWPKADEKSWSGQNEFIQLVNKVMPYVKNNKVMIQAGGNCGLILSTFVKNFEMIYTFEPDPINFYCLNQNVQESNVIKMQCCLGDRYETVETQQLIRPQLLHDIGGVHVKGKGFTPTIVIDDLNLLHCDLIQLDVEGYEYKAISGMTNTIRKFKPVLCIEFCEKWLNRYDTSSEKLISLIEDLGYEQVDSYGVDKIFTHKKTS